MTKRGDNCFPKSHRLRKRREYLEVQKTDLKAHSRAFVGLIQLREGSLSRLGITTSKRLGNAVVRNRTKRIIREAFRNGVLDLPSGVDVVVIAKRAAASLTTQQLFEDLHKLGNRISGAIGAHT